MSGIHFSASANSRCAKRGCGTKTQDSKEGMNIYTVMTVKNIDTGNSQNRNAKTGKYVYNTHIYPTAVT